MCSEQQFDCRRPFSRDTSVYKQLVACPKVNVLRVFTRHSAVLNAYNTIEVMPTSASHPVIIQTQLPGQPTLLSTIEITRITRFQRDNDQRMSTT